MSDAVRRSTESFVWLAQKTPDSSILIKIGCGKTQLSHTMSVICQVHQKIPVFLGAGTDAEVI